MKLKVKGWGKEYKENKYKDEKKNWTTLLYHVGLWDGNKKLTRLGELFLKRNSSSLNENANLLDEFAQIILVLFMATAFGNTVTKYGARCKSCNLKYAVKFKQKCW